MSKKDYVMIAAVFHAECSSADFNAFTCKSLENVANGLADKFQESNPRFDRDRFLAACGF